MRRRYNGSKTKEVILPLGSQNVPPTPVTENANHSSTTADNSVTEEDDPILDVEGFSSRSTSPASPEQISSEPKRLVWHRKCSLSSPNSSAPSSDSLPPLVRPPKRTIDEHPNCSAPNIAPVKRPRKTLGIAAAVIRVPRVPLSRSLRRVIKDIDLNIGKVKPKVRKSELDRQSTITHHYLEPIDTKPTETAAAAAAAEVAALPQTSAEVDVKPSFESLLNDCSNDSVISVGTETTTEQSGGEQQQLTFPKLRLKSEEHQSKSRNTKPKLVAVKDKPIDHRYISDTPYSRTQSSKPHLGKQKVPSMLFKSKSYNENRLMSDSTKKYVIDDSSAAVVAAAAAAMTSASSTMTTDSAVAGSSSSSSSSQLSPFTLTQAQLANLGNSMATLCNIGNTCYLNSVVYTLRFTPQFLHNLHHLVEDIGHMNQRLGQTKAKSSSLGRIVGGLQGQGSRSWSSKDLVSLGSQSITCDIPKTNRQITIERLHELFQNLHRNELIESIESFHADTFLHAIQDVSAIFEGNQQQDAHEFLMCILDSLRETCQSLSKVYKAHSEVTTNASNSSATPLKVVNAKETLPVSSKLASVRVPLKSSLLPWRNKRKNEKISAAASPQDNPPTCTPTPKDKETDEKSTTPGDGDSGVKSTLTMNGHAADEAVDGSATAAVASATSDTQSAQSPVDTVDDRLQKLGLDFFTKDFEGVTISKTKCLACETVTKQKETMVDIAVPISEDQRIMDLIDRPHLFFQEACVTKEFFSGDNKFRCEQCIGYTEAIRSISFEVLPRLLIIQLKRFSGGMEKINSYIPTPFTLPCFCLRCLSLPDTDKDVYKLYSVITHVGATMSVGHYVAYTTTLDFYGEYVNCAKTKLTATTKKDAAGNTQNSGLNNTATSFLEQKKKKLFGQSRAGAAAVTKKLSLNRVQKKIEAVVGNGCGGNTTAASVISCHGLHCCGVHVKYLPNPSPAITTTASYMNGGDSCGITTNGHSLVNGGGGGGGSHLSQHKQSNGSSSSLSLHSKIQAGNNGTSNSTSALASIVTVTAHPPPPPPPPPPPSPPPPPPSPPPEPLWYMCDDDKIKTMTQREFEDLLSASHKKMITPYLLFYARS